MKINKILRKVNGTIIVELEGFFIERFLNLCKIQGVKILDIKYITPGLIIFKTNLREFSKIRILANKTKCKVRIKKKKGIYFILCKYRKRRVFFYLTCVTIVLMIISSTFIFNINISGNKKVTNEEIKDALKKAGIYVGKNRMFVDEKKAGNIIRTAIYDVAWVGVEVKGTRVNVKVVEKKTEKKDDDKDVPGNIIANKSGTITKIIAEKGTAKLLTGSYIEKGMIAIEGVIESEIIEPLYVPASGILKIKNTYVFEREEKYEVKEKRYTNRKRYGIEIDYGKINFELKQLPKDYVYDKIKKSKTLNLLGKVFEVTMLEFKEYEMKSINRNEEKIMKILVEEYKKYRKEKTQNNEIISNEIVEINKSKEGITYKVTYDLEEKIGVFVKKGE
ncbi:MAG: sporulation protein YqfD [Clostridia bacterium]|nr:sporulation protein YqfD [Clostridia bacterium]MDD4375696.1 sporulation protein YqfD [Clostridia bacterium]